MSYDPLYYKAYYQANKEKKKSYQDAHKEEIKSYRASRKEEAQAYSKAYYEANKEKKNASSKTWYEVNKEKFKTYQKNWYLDNKEEIKSYHEIWYQLNKEKRSAQMKLWRQTNPEKSRAARARRRAKEALAVIEPIRKNFEDFLKEIWGNQCAYCRNTSDKWHQDHFMPLELKGNHIEANLVLACPSCNQKKHAKHPFAFIKEQKICFTFKPYMKFGY